MCGKKCDQTIQQNGTAKHSNKQKWQSISINNASWKI